MIKSALLTTVKKFEIDSDLYLVSFFDLEPSGIIVHAYNQVNSNILTLPIKETELSAAGITRHQANLTEFLSTIELVRRDGVLVLESNNRIISKIKKRPTGDQLEEMMLKPMLGDQSDSIQKLLVTGLMQICKEKPAGNDAVQRLGEWLLENNPNKPIVEDPED